MGTRLQKILITLIISITHATALKYDCSKSEYSRCVNLADPLIREPNLIFPDNIDDIDSVCRTWNQFVDCLKRYIDNCFTDQQRKVFNKAVENPIESVHQMCTQTSYQTEYLKYASCIKSTVTEMSHCGVQYSLLVEQVSKGDAIARASLCCSHHRFKQCVVQETQRLCDAGVPNGNAVRFSSQIIDKALSFLQEQCFNYIPNSGDCPVTPATIDQMYTGTSITNDVKYRSNPTHSSVPQPTNPAPNLGSNTIPDSYQPQNNAYEQPQEHPTEVSWLPTQTQDNNIMPDQNRQSTVDIIASTRARPSSYGRASSWMPSQPTETSEKPTWATMSTWHVYSQDAGENKPATETWYPAAGSYAGNSIDEPNQQGLSKLPNNFGNSLSTASHLTLLASVGIFYVIVY